MIRLLTFPVSFALLFNFLWVGLTLLLFTSNLTQAQQITTVAGGNDRGSAPNQLDFPSGVFLNTAGNIYVVDQSNHRVQKFPPTSTSATSGSTVAGKNEFGTGPGYLQEPTNVFVDAAGYIYVADSDNNRIQKFPPNSTSATNGTTVAGGNGQGSGPRQLDTPRGVFVNAAGFIYVSDQSNARIQKFPPTSTSATSGSTVAGGNGRGSGAKQFDFPSSLVVDGSGNIYVADSYNHRIQKFPSNSTSTTSGTTVAGGNGEGSGANQLRYPRGVFVSGTGIIYVADTFNHRIQKFPSNSTSATSASTVAGTGIQGSDLNQLAHPASVFVNTAGFIYIADMTNARIQKYSATIVPVILSQPVASASACSGSSVLAQVSVSSIQPLTYQWYKNKLSSPVSGQTSATLSLTNVQTSDAGSYSVVITSAGNSVTSTAFMLSVQPGPQASLAVSGSLNCAQTSVTLTATGGTNYAFSGPGIVSQNTLSGTAVVNASGLYSVTATVENGCTATASTTVVGDPNGPLLSLITAQPANTTVSQGQTAQFSLSTSGSGLSLQWQLNAGGGFVNLTNDATYSGVNSTTLNAASTATYQSGYAYRAVVTSGTCSATSSPATLTVNPVPDLSPVLYVRPSTVNGTQPISVVVDVVELKGVTTRGPITVKLNKDNLLSLSLVSEATSIGGTAVQNSAWTLDDMSNEAYYVLTTSQSIMGGNKLSFGLSGLLRPGSSTGTVTLSSVVVEGSGGEVKITNNSDAEKIEYFQQ